MKTILFQGDSITQTGRVRENEKDIGYGYPMLVTAKLGCDCPGAYHFINKGISGNRIIDLYARMGVHIIKQKPDYMSILIGINDLWQSLPEYSNGLSTEKFEMFYTMLLEEVFAALPDLKIFIMGPYILPGVLTNEHYDRFRPEVEERIATVKRVAKKFGLPFVDLQKKFDDACQLAEEAYWTYDGIHPTNAGHELIARAWLETFETIK